MSKPVINNSTKKHMITQTKFRLTSNYSKLPIYKPLRQEYEQPFELPNNFTNIPFVEVVEVSGVDLVMKCVFETGSTSTCIVGCVHRDWDGSEKDNFSYIYCDPLYFRSNICVTLENESVFPIKDSEVIFTPGVAIVRDKQTAFLSQAVFTSTIIVAPPINPQLVPLKSKFGIKEEHMNSKDYISAYEMINNIFQTAIRNKRTILVLDDFGMRKNKIPSKDIIDLYNICITKYGHMFSHIYVSIPFTEGGDGKILQFFRKHIIHPQYLLEKK